VVKLSDGKDKGMYAHRGVEDFAVSCCAKNVGKGKQRGDGSSKHADFFFVAQRPKNLHKKVRSVENSVVMQKTAQVFFVVLIRVKRFHCFSPLCEKK